MRRFGTVAAGLAIGAGVWWLRPFRVEVAGDSMAPTLGAGDFLIAIRRRRIRRGDVVVLAIPAGGFDVVKRVVGLPGERLRTDGRTVWVDGRALAEPYAHGQGPGGRWALGPEEYLVLGDHRARSTDGRRFGPVSRRSIEGRAVLRYWPRIGLVR